MTRVILDVLQKIVLLNFLQGKNVGNLIFRCSSHTLKSTFLKLVKPYFTCVIQWKNVMGNVFVASVIL
jgi:hypothetical protein